MLRRTAAERVPLLDRVTVATAMALEVALYTVPHIHILGVVGHSRHMIKFQFSERVYFRMLGNVNFLNVSAVCFAFVCCVVVQFSRVFLCTGPLK